MKYMDIKKLAESFTGNLDPNAIDGIDTDMIAVIAPMLNDILTAYYRLEITGLDRIPKGPALIVINHQSGISFLEILGFGARYYVERGLDDPIHGLAHDLILRVPGLANFLLRGGAVRANHENADALFAKSRKLMVAPGGNLEAFRPYSERNQIKMGSHRGFLRLALRHEVPIVPVVFEGGHASYRVLWDGAPLAKIARRFGMRLDAWPLFLGLPWGVAFGPLFHIPLPVKIRIGCLDPISTAEYGPAAENDPAVLDQLFSTVVTSMQRELLRLGTTTDPS